MTHVIDLSPEVEAWLEREASERGQTPTEYHKATVEALLIPAGEDDAPTDWDALDRIIDESQIDTGIEDLAHQHDHYIHGTPKRH